MKEILEFKGPYFFLSNFYPSAFVWLGLRWPTAEHAFQAMKSQDPKIWKVVQNLRTPADAKNFGRHNIRLRKDWEVVKIPTMAEVQEAKYSMPLMEAKLLRTEDAYLSEGNWHGDDFWGYCFKTKQGRNELGKLIMTERARKVTVIKLRGGLIG